MSEIATHDDPAAEPATPEATDSHGCKWALILDLDLAAANGPDLLRAACASALSDAGITLDNVRFARYLLGETPLDGVTALLASLKQPKDKAAGIAAAISSSFIAAISQAPARPTVRALAAQAAKQEGFVVGLTSLGADAAATILTAVGLPADTVVVEATAADGWGGFSTDTWSRAARAAHLPERTCMAVTATAGSARSALMANLNVTAFVGPLTDHQDFGGVDFIGSGTSAKDAETIVETLLARL